MDLYGVNETNPITETQRQIIRDAKRKVEWTEPGLRITRLRLVSDPGFPMWDVSYCFGVLDGEPVEVELPFSQLPKRNRVSAIIEYAKADRVYAKRLGILDAMSTLN